MRKRLSHIRFFICGLSIVNFILISDNNNQTIAYCQEVDSIFVDNIVLYSDRGGYAEIYMINPDGTGEVRLTTNNIEDIVPDISPYGNQIVLASNRDGNYEIYKNEE